MVEEAIPDAQEPPGNLVSPGKLEPIARGAACAVENLLETRSARPGGSLVGTRRPGAGSSDWGVSAQAVALFPGRDLRLDGLAGLAVALLNPADQLVALTLDLVEVVVRQLSPLFLDLALHLVPLAVQPGLIHRLLLLERRSPTGLRLRELGGPAGPGDEAFRTLPGQRKPNAEATFPARRAA